MTIDETWFYHYGPEPKLHSMDLRLAAQHEIKKIPSAKILWDSPRLDFLGSRRHPPHYLPKGQTINADNYSFLLVQLKDILKEKRRGKFTSGVFFLHDNCPPYRTLANQKKLPYMGFRYLDHPPYSAYLAAWDCHLFPGLKKQLNVHHFFANRRTLLPRGSGWRDNILNFFEWLAKVRGTY